jgi:hypothetical protein
MVRKTRRKEREKKVGERRVVMGNQRAWAWVQADSADAPFFSGTGAGTGAGTGTAIITDDGYEGVRVTLPTSKHKQAQASTSKHKQAQEGRHDQMLLSPG